MNLALKIWSIIFYAICTIVIIGVTVFLYFTEFWVGIGMMVLLIIGIGIWLLTRWGK